MKNGLHILLLIFCLISYYTSVAQTKRALVIGVGKYPELSGWKTINGDKDVPIVTGMLNNLGFKHENIYVLVNEKATYKNIINQFDRMIKTSNSGDVIYIHFSGHGQLISDTNGDEKDGFDESIVPYDAFKQYKKGVYEGQHHITDDLINSYLSDLKHVVGKNGMIIFVDDACHSGDISRCEDAEEKDVARGTMDKFILGKVSNSKTIKESPIDWISISACKSYQTNYEYKTSDGHSIGKLTYLINRSIKEVKTLTITNLMNYVSKMMVEISKYPQEPELDCPTKYRNYLLKR
jgi:hypothetical protein